jgi:hypothetical protein
MHKDTNYNPFDCELEQEESLDDLIAGIEATNRSFDTPLQFIARFISNLFPSIKIRNNVYESDSENEVFILIERRKNIRTQITTALRHTIDVARYHALPVTEKITTIHKEAS